ncbi:MAG: ferrous iron transport protein B, partial [Polyangiaceae bacterium]
MADDVSSSRHSEHAKRPLVALIGNPNTGKTTVFNALSGSRARVGNYPGITVERRSADLRFPALKTDEEGTPTTAELLDLPGTYSLAARSKEERIAIAATLGIEGCERPDLVVLVADAGQLVRNMYLALQLIELEVPLIIALNMIDEVASPPDAEELTACLGVPCVATSARGGEGIEQLRALIQSNLTAPPHGSVNVSYDAALLSSTIPVVEALPAAWRRDADEARTELGRNRALALWALSSVDAGHQDAEEDFPPDLRRACLACFEEFGSGDDLDDAIITARYRWLDERIGPLAQGAEAKPDDAVPISDRVDRVLLHPVWGFAIFIGIMLLVFQSLFTWADPAIGWVEAAFGWLGDALKANMAEGIVRDLLTEGVVGGVGNVVVFLPQILLLFLLLGLLEDSGYMARAAYLMDRIMNALGLHGRAFVPMLSGCACAIPAIMATRTMERERDRLLTMLVIPLMTCSARLPVYTLIIAALFPPTHLFGFVPVQGLLMMAMYVIATATTLLAAAVLGRTVVKGRRMPLLLELPPYRMPTLKVVMAQTVSRGGVFLKEAGTVILAFTIILWALLSFPKVDSDSAATSSQASITAPATNTAVAAKAPDGQPLATSGHVPDGPNPDTSAGAITQSYGGRLGKAIEPL